MRICGELGFDRLNGARVVVIREDVPVQPERVSRLVLGLGKKTKSRRGTDRDLQSLDEGVSKCLWACCSGILESEKVVHGGGVPRVDCQSWICTKQVV